MDKSLRKEIFYLSLGEALVTLITVLGYYLLSLAFEDINFDYTVITGAVLGCVVVIINFLVLSLAVNRAINGFVHEIGDRTFTDEEADEFAKAHQAHVKLAITRSYIFRTFLTLATLVLAFLLAWFNPIATAIPLFAYKPVMYAIQLIKGRGGNK